MEAMEKIPVALIVDSPWIPAYTGVSTIDYFTLPDTWYRAQQRIKKDFPDLIFIPDLWVEFGMTAEPSGFGCKTMFFENNTPTISHIAKEPEDIQNLCNLKLPNPKTDGVMPIVLNLYKNAYLRFKDTGESIKIVAARGPLTIASHIMGVTDFLISLKIYPDETHKLLKLASDMARVWLEAQAEVLPDVGGIIVLDDISGFLSKSDYLEFAHGYFKCIYDAFPGSLKIFHNDTDNTIPYEFIHDLGVQIFNFTHLEDIGKVKQLCGDKVCLMGNIPPMEVLGMGTPDMVKQSALECMKAFPDRKGLLLSAGGGTSPGTPKENILAMFDAVNSN
jgi:uroporphyrinogen-III decarboxylase